MLDSKLTTATLALYESDSNHPALTPLGLVSRLWCSLEEAEALLTNLSVSIQERAEHYASI